MGELTFWEKLDLLLAELLHKFLCYRDKHDYIAWDNVDVCAWCEKEKEKTDA